MGVKCAITCINIASISSPSSIPVSALRFIHTINIHTSNVTASTELFGSAFAPECAAFEQEFDRAEVNR